jgi:hypothetical protein
VFAGGLLMNHLTNERLIVLACDPDREYYVPPEEGSHLDECEECFGKLVEIVKTLQVN